MQYDLYLFLNICISAVVSILLWYILPKKLQQPKWPMITLFFSFSMFLPIVGVFFLVVATILSHWFDRKIPEEVIKTIFTPTFVREKISAPVSFGESGAWVRLNNSNATNANRMQAMFAVNSSETAAANSVNLKMLQENNDQLRLYAFGILNTQTKEIDQRISELKNRLNKTESADDKTQLKKNLAFLYWEMVFNHLVKDDLLTYSIKKATQYAFEALDENKDDAGLWVLLGKIYFYKKEFAKAKEALEKAEKLRAPYEKILPYLAELSFKERDFAKIREYLSLSDTFRYMPKLYDIAKFWGASWKKR